MVASALLTLSALYLSHEEQSLRERAETISDNAAHVALSVVENYMETDTMDLAYGDIPPFVMQWLYVAGTRFLKGGDLEKLSTIERSLERLNAKWKSAGVLSVSLQLLAIKDYLY